MKNIVLIMSLVFAQGAFSKSKITLTPEQKAKHQSWMDYINNMDASYAKYPVDMCGYAMPITIGEEMVAPFMEASANAEMYCEEIRTKLSTMCRNAKELKNKNKEKITKLVKKISCRLASKEDEVKFKVGGGELTAYLGPRSANLSEELLKFMDQQPF